MESTPLVSSFLALIGLSLVLGVRHGFDADHLATIDGISRHHFFAGQPRTARWSGLMFSLGHGAAVIAMAVAFALGGKAVALPRWLEDSGALISILFLVVLGVANLVTALRAQPGEAMQVAGLRARVLRRLPLMGSPWGAVCVGVLFAASFDAVAQAVWFAAQGQFSAGWSGVFALSGAFAAGMVLADMLNGLWIAHLIGRSERYAWRAARLFAVVVALIALSVASLGASKYLSSTVRDWSEGKELVFGGGVVIAVVVGYVIAVLMGRRASGTVRPDGKQAQIA
jgi:high-affinity nickel-transport protein